MSSDILKKIDPKELTTDEWSNQYPKLVEDIDCHLNQYLDDSDDSYDIRRLIFISIRQHLGDKL